jgi:hypothetical protein
VGTIVYFNAGQSASALKIAVHDDIAIKSSTSEPKSSEVGCCGDDGACSKAASRYHLADAPTSCKGRRPESVGDPCARRRSHAGLLLRPACCNQEGDVLFAIPTTQEQDELTVIFQNPKIEYIFVLSF